MDRLRLESLIKLRGYSIEDVCKELGISRSAFYRKLRGISEFTQSEIQHLIIFLNIEEPIPIFFADIVSYKTQKGE